MNDSHILLGDWLARTGSVLEVPTTLRVLLVEDSEIDATFILRELRRGGFTVKHERVETAETMTAALEKSAWDLIISDYSLPTFDGIAALSIFKAAKLDIPFLIVSGAIGEEVAAGTMAAGAHDYIMKRNLSRLVPAVQRELREAGMRRERRRVSEENRIRASQQSAVAELGQAALRMETSWSELLGETAQIMRATLEGELSAVLELVNENELLLRAGIGWQAGLVGSAKSNVASENQAGFTLLSDEPVIVEELATETRFIGALILAEHKIFSSLSVVIRGAQKIWGVLSVHTTERRKFSASDASFLQSLAQVLAISLARRAVEAELRASHERFALVVQATNDGFWDWDLATDFVFYSPRWKVMLGYADTSIQPHISEWKRLVHPEDVARALATTEEILADGVRNFDLEYRLLHQNGDYRWVISRSVVLRNDEGRATRIVSSHADITERKRADEALRESEERFRLLVEGVKDHAIIMLDPQGNVLNWNPGAQRIKGYKADEIIGKHFSVFHPAEEVENGRPVMEMELATSVGHFEDEGWSVRKDGSRFFANFVLTALHDKAGELRGFCLVTHDVTERSQAEATLRRSEEKYRSIVRNIPDVTWTADEQGQITFISPNVARVLGFNPEEMEQGGPAQWFGRIHQDDVEQVREAYAKLFAENVKFEVEYRFQRKDDHWIWVSNRAVGAYEVEGVMLADGLVSDVTAKKRADAALRQSEERFQLVARATNDAVWDWDLITNDLWWNEGYQSLFGYAPEEIEPGVASWYKKMHPEDAQRVVFGIQQFIENSGELWSDEYRFLRRDGRYATIYARGQVVRNAAGKAIRMIGAMQDVTERRRADEALRLLGSAVQQATESIVITDANLTAPGPQIIFVNPAFTKMTGYESSEVIGKSPRVLQGPLTDRAMLAKFRTDLDAGRSFHGETYNYRKDGSAFINEWQVNPIRSKDGMVTHYLAVQRDVTERKRAEQKIIEQASLLDLAQDAIVVRKLDGQIEFWNQGAAQMYGWVATEAVGKRVTELLFDGDSEEHAEAEKFLLSRGEWSGELKQIHKTGNAVIVNSRWTLVRDAAGQPKSVLTINSDITEKKQLEAQFLRAQRMDSIGTLASGVAHDLNNILAPIMMSVPMFRCNLPPEERERLVETIETSAQRGASIVKQLLAFGRGVEGERVVVQVRHLVNEMVTIARETFPKNITISSKIPKDLWALKADPTHLHQVLLNFCVNARDAMPRGGSLTLKAENITLCDTSISSNPNTKPGPYVVLEAQDTGTGIPPEIMEKIFDPFFTTKEVGKGTGLGLSTVLGIVKGHGGFVNVASEIGKGTTFRVFLPALPNADAGTGKTEHFELPKGKGEMVLVVDDEPGIREAASRILTSHGYQAIVAGDGAEALALYTQHRDTVKVVITDLMMPIMDGLALVRVLRKMDPNVRIIATSGLAQDEKFEELKLHNVRTFLTKPYTAEMLLNGLRDLLAVK